MGPYSGTPWGGVLLFESILRDAEVPLLCLEVLCEQLAERLEKEKFDIRSALVGRGPHWAS